MTLPVGKRLPNLQRFVSFIEESLALTIFPV
jgi:hypothetical protein